MIMRSDSRVLLQRCFLIACYLFVCIGFTADQPVRSEAPKRIVSLAPSVTETVVALEAEQKLVGVTRYSNYLSAVKDRPEVGGLTDTNYEQILSLKPDIVLIKSAEQSDQKKKLEEVGLKVRTFEQETISDILRSIRRIGKIVGDPEIAERRVQQIQQQMKELRKKTNHVKRSSALAVVSRRYGTGSVEKAQVAGKNTFLHEMLRLAGGKNLYEGPPPYGKVSAEFLLSNTPSYLLEFIPRMKDRDFTHQQIRRDWLSLNMFSEENKDRILIIDHPYAVIPGPRFIEVAQDIAKHLHPELDWQE